MKFTDTSVAADVGILWNSLYVAKPYDCTELATLATNDIIPAGTFIPANDATAEGVLLHDVNLAENPNGTVVIFGFIKTSALPAQPAASVDIPMLKFM